MISIVICYYVLFFTVLYLFKSEDTEFLKIFGIEDFLL